MEDIELAWPLNSVVYQIYPRSFYDKTGDGIGDLQGITAKLDYLQYLGINAIWLSPVYPSPQADFGYDVADYTDIDKIYGTLSDFDELLAASHKNGIKIMMDFIPNHTSSQHAWFMDSKSSKDNPKRDWYIWRDPGPNNTPPNNWQSVFGGSAWEYDETTEQYYYHAFDINQPDLNWRNLEVQHAMFDAMRFWLDRGVDGFRVDAIYWLFEDAEFGDEPLNPHFQENKHATYDALVHTKTFGLDETLDVVQKMVDVVKEYDNRFLVTEAYLGINELIKMYETIDWDYYAPFNFSLITLPWDAKIHKEYIDDFDAKIGNTRIPVYVLGNHDVPRVATRIGREQARVAAMLQLTLRGLPFIYQGEEIGMINGTVPPDRIQDPQAKGSPNGELGRDPERTPMQWDSTSHAGFTHGDPWLPIASNYLEVNVEKEKTDASSYLSLYRKLIDLKKNNKSLRRGDYEGMPLPAENVLSNIRKFENESLLIVLNMSGEKKDISIPAKGKILCDTAMKRLNEEVDLNDFTLGANEGLILQLQN